MQSFNRCFSLIILTSISITFVATHTKLTCEHVPAVNVELYLLSDSYYHNYYLSKVFTALLQLGRRISVNMYSTSICSIITIIFTNIKSYLNLYL